jgi:signal transduction histidine kinase
MRLLLGLAPRILLGAALATAAALVVIMVFYIRGANDLVTRQVGDFAVELMREDALGCRLHPERFGLGLASGSRVDAYDAATLRSANPAAPPLPEDQARAIRAGQDRLLVDRVLRGRGGDLLVRVGASGPCSLLRIHWATDPGLRSQTILRISLTIAAALVLVVGLAALWVVRPLLGRIRDLAGQAVDVGAPGARIGRGGEARDELELVEAGLASAHARLLEDRARLEAQHQALSRHLSHVAHDLRTPIAALLLALERERARGARSEALDAAVADAMYLESLAENLRVETALSQDVDVEGTASLGDIVDRVLGRLRPFAETRGVTLDAARPDDPVEVDAPELHLERAVANLVENAIRYNRPGGHVALVLEAEDARFRLEVADDGPGAPEAVLEALLEPGYRADAARRRDRRRTGLGLTITREVAARAGLDLVLERGEPTGLVVRISGSSAPRPPRRAQRPSDRGDPAPA